MLLELFSPPQTFSILHSPWKPSLCFFKKIEIHAEFIFSGRSQVSPGEVNNDCTGSSCHLTVGAERHCSLPALLPALCANEILHLGSPPWGPSALCGPSMMLQRHTDMITKSPNCKKCQFISILVRSTLFAVFKIWICFSKGFTIYSADPLHKKTFSRRPRRATENMSLFNDTAERTQCETPGMISGPCPIKDELH